MFDWTTASPSLPNFFTYCLCTTSRNCSCVMPNSLQQRADREECAEERVALHAQLQIATVRRLAGNCKPGQREDANVLFDNLLARPRRQVLPCALAFGIRLPHQASAFLNAIERIGMRERLGVAAQHRRHVAQIAVHANTVFRRDHEVASRGALLLRSILRIGGDVNHFLRIAFVVDLPVALEKQIVQVAQNRAQILSGRDRAPSADRVEANRHGPLGQKRW